MNLPTLNVPVDFVKLHSLKKPVKVRPYLVGEEKILLMAQAAQQQGNKDEAEKAVRQVIQQCTFGEISMDTLPVFDVTMLFLKLRAMSLNNIIESQFRCQNDVHPVDSSGAVHLETKKCNTLVPVRIDIADIKLTVPVEHSNRVVLDDLYGITLKYPNASVYDAAMKSADMGSVVAQCLETIYKADGSQVWEAKDESADDLQTFVNQLTLANIDKIRTTFFDTMPRLEYHFEFKCPKCGYIEDVVLQEFEDFFD